MTKKVLGCGVLAVGAFLIIGLMVGGLVVSLDRTPRPETAHNQFKVADVERPEPPKQNVTRAAYEALAVGMTHEQCVEIIGTEGEESASTTLPGFGSTSETTSQIYLWRAEGFMAGNITAAFTNGKLTSKAQIGLK